MSRVMLMWRFFQRSIRNKLLVAVPAILGFVLLVTFSLSFLFLRQQLLVFGIAEHQIMALLTTQSIAFALIASVIIVTVVVVIAAIAHLLSDPLSHLSQDVTQAATNQSYRLSKALVNRDDEVGIFAHHLDRLLQQVGEQTKALTTATAHAALGRMAQQIAHDLRSPLVAIQAMVRFLRDHRDAQDVSQAIEGLERGCARLHNIAETLLEQREEGPATEPCAWFPIHTICDELIREFQIQPLGAGVEFLSTHTEEVCIAGNRTGLQRAVGNIMKNALEAMQHMEPQRPRRLRLCSYSRQDHIILEVADSGPGIPAEVIPRVLHGGFTAGKADGHGIGMQIVRDVVAAHSGSLTCDSLPDHGTTFRLTFPHARAA